MITIIVFILVMWGIIYYFHTLRDKGSQTPEEKLANANAKDINLDALYQNFTPCNPNEYHYKTFNKKTPITAVFPRPNTKTFKVDHWQTQINAVDVALKIYDPNYDHDKSTYENQDVFDTIFQNYLRAYIQSFNHYQDYDIQITIRHSSRYDQTLGIVNQQAIIEFNHLKQEGTTNEKHL